MFESWAGFSLICPDFDDFKLQGNTASMVSQNIEFRMTQCTSDCSPTMDDYVRDIQIDSWAIFEKINLAQRQGKPVFQVMDLQGTWIPSQDVSINTNYLIKKNIINTKDEIFDLG
jgi:hypothetical protein